MANVGLRELYWNKKHGAQSQCKKLPVPYVAFSWSCKIHAINLIKGTNRMHKLINKHMMIIQAVSFGIMLLFYVMGLGSSAYSVGQKLKSLGNSGIDAIHVLYWQHMRNTLVLWNALLGNFISQPFSFTPWPLLPPLILPFYIIFCCYKEQQMTGMKPHLVLYVVWGGKNTFWTSTG